MSGYKDVLKSGWHPKGKGGGKESWRGDNKGINTVAGWMGKGKSPVEAAQEHQSAPLSTLKDPASFGPPPKHVKYYGAGASSSSAAPSPTSHVEDTGGLGGSVPTGARQRMQEAQEARAREEEEANRPPPGPYRANTTGLRTDHLPKPPAFRPGSAAASPVAGEPAKQKPKLPPRLPPRQNSHPDTYSAPPPPSYTEATQPTPAADGYLNQGALNRLGSSGVSVPGFNIGRTASPPVPPRQNSTPPAPDTSRSPQLGELQSRFASMSKPSQGAPATGTTWAEKQAALKTASNFRNDPSKVSLSDMRNAASTANNFRERHGEQAASGLRTVNGLNQKYGIADRVNSYAGSSASPASPAAPPAPSPTQGGFGKKPPPPPPPKKKGLTSDPTSPSEPPPVPLSSKPKFS
ncbi:hypothetical protein BS50DRAFT_30760 [Corynespora cassiicola Philippines]|uniref:GMP synthase n=1 Tax=Corynespora cassiicola Philippines TaxID=1448308 RepID=A0A2T2PBH8_CORCC|nr:hypothetical protein BS50DRAFT_30760 [Corynespora cassiicola Philippines]